MFAMWTATVTLLTFILALVSAAPSSSSSPEPFEWSLIPARNHSLDALHPKYLQPSRNVQLYFAALEDPDAFASSDTKQSFDTVVLETSAYIQHASCQGGRIEITFDSTAATNIARRWPDKDLVLITNHETCNPVNDRGVYMVTGKWQWDQTQPLQLKANIEQTDWKHVTETMELTYGVKSREPETTVHGSRKRSSACSILPKPKTACGALACARQGIALNPQIIWRTPADAQAEVFCAKLCLADEKCVSFSHHKKTEYCTGYGESVKAQECQREASDLFFYDRDCWEATGDCPNITLPEAPSSKTTAPYQPEDSPYVPVSHRRASSTFGSVSSQSFADYQPYRSRSVDSSGASRPTGAQYYSPHVSVSPTPYAQAYTASVSFASVPSPSPIKGGYGSYSRHSSLTSAELSSSRSQSWGEEASSSIAQSSSPFAHVSSAEAASLTPSLHSSSLHEGSSSSSQSVAHTSSVEPTVSSSSTHSASGSAVPTLNPPELYLFSLFNDGIVTTESGNVLADLGANGTTNATLGMGPIDFEDATEQARLRQIIMEAQLPSAEESFEIVDAALDAAGAQKFSGIPSFINETLPDDVELASVQPFSKRDTIPMKTRDIVISERSVSVKQKRGLLDMIFGGLVDLVIDEVLSAICKTCAQVYDFYTKITDPFFLIGEICQPCRPALQMREMITNPFGYARDVLDWYFENGRYDPQGINTPPPRPVIPPPIEASSVVSAQINMRWPMGTTMINPLAGRFACLDCGVFVSSITVWGTLVVDVQRGRVQKALFRTDIQAAQGSAYLYLKNDFGVNWRGGNGVGSRPVGTIGVSNLFRVDISYANVIDYNIRSSGPHDITFGIQSSTIGASATFDVAFRRLDAQSGWNSAFNVIQPSLGFATDFDGTVVLQGVVSFDITVLGEKHRESAITFSTSLGVRSRVIAPDDPNAGVDGTCGERETQLDSWVGSYTSVVTNTVFNVNQPLGRRCLKLKSYAEMNGAPQQPYCGNTTLSSGVMTWKGQDYNMVCSRGILKSRSTGGRLGSYPDIRTLDACLDKCNSEPYCLYAGWEVRNHPYKCRLYHEIITTEDTWYQAYAEKINIPPVSSVPVSVPPRPTASACSRAPIFHTTLTPPSIPSFTPPPEAPAPPLPPDYPPRNPEGYCADLADGPYVLDADIGEPFESLFDVECGTTMDYNGALLTWRGNVGMADCMRYCRSLGTDCQAIMMGDFSRNCLIVKDGLRQRYSTNGTTAFARKVRTHPTWGVEPSCP